MLVLIANTLHIDVERLTDYRHKFDIDSMRQAVWTELDRKQKTDKVCQCDRHCGTAKKGKQYWTENVERLLTKIRLCC